LRDFTESELDSNSSWVGAQLGFSELEAIQNKNMKVSVTIQVSSITTQKALSAYNVVRATQDTELHLTVLRDNSVQSLFVAAFHILFSLSSHPLREHDCCYDNTGQ